MPRGRPRKNPLPVVEEVTETEEATKTEVTTEEEKTTPAKKKKEDDTPRCVCCGTKVYSSRRLNLELLTSLASYYFAIADTKPYICNQCASELGGVIDKWLIKHGAEIKPYYKPAYFAKKHDENLNEDLKEDNLNG